MGLAKPRQRVQIRQRILRSQGRVYLINFLFDFVRCQPIMARPDSIPPPPAIIGADMTDFQPWNFKSVVFKPLGILKNLGKGAVGYQFVAQSPDLVVKIKLLQTGMMIFASRTPCRASIAACFTSFFHCFNQTFLCMGAGERLSPPPPLFHQNGSSPLSPPPANGSNPFGRSPPGKPPLGKPSEAPWAASGGSCSFLESPK